MLFYILFLNKEVNNNGTEISNYLSEEIVKLEINEDGVFINDEKIEEKDEAYSFNFYDTLIPTIQTGNEVNNIKRCKIQQQ